MSAAQPSIVQHQEDPEILEIVNVDLIDEPTTEKVTFLNLREMGYKGLFGGLETPTCYLEETEFLKKRIKIEINVKRTIENAKFLFLKCENDFDIDKICLNKTINADEVSTLSKCYPFGLVQVGKHTKDIEIYVPDIISERKTLFMILDGDEIVSKGMVIALFESDFKRPEIGSRDNLLEGRQLRLQSLEKVIETLEIGNEKVYQNPTLLKIINLNQKCSSEDTYYLISFDGRKLAYRFYQNCKDQDLKSIILFFEGNFNYLDYMAKEVSERQQSKCVVCNFRGFGRSDGERGVANSNDAIFKDIRTFVRYFRYNFSDIPIFLGGFDFTAGILLSYSDWKEKEPVDGNILLAPRIVGRKARKIIRPENYKDRNFQIHFGNLILSSITAGRFRGSRPGISLNLPAVAFKINPEIANTISTNVIRAFRVNDIKRVIQEIDVPTLMMIGRKDEALIAENVFKYFDKYKNEELSETLILDNVSHFDILLECENINAWIKRTLSDSRFGIYKSSFEVPEECPSSDDVANNESKSFLDLEILRKLTLENISAYNLKKTFMEGMNDTRITFRFVNEYHSQRAIIVLYDEFYKINLLDSINPENEFLCFHLNAEFNENEIDYNIDKFILFCKSNYNNIPIFVISHGQNANSLMKYASKSSNTQASGYIFLSPVYTNEYYKRERKISLQKLIQINSGALSKRNPLLNQLDGVDEPCALWIGSDDEYLNSLNPSLPLANSDNLFKNIIEVIAPGQQIIIKDPKLHDIKKLEIIGEGSFGRVWLVQHIATGKYMAMKTLLKKQLIEENCVQRVIQERNLQQCLSSPFVVPVLGSFQDDEHIYILMEFVIGGELYSYVKLSGNLQSDEAKFYAAELVLILEYLHTNNIIYRDLKLENLLLDCTGHLRITDFGFSRYLTPGSKAKSFCGSPCYTAPEIIMGIRYNESVDIWALGIIIYELFTGQSPFWATDVNVVYRRILYEKLEFPYYFDSEAQDLVSRLLVKDVAKRLGCGHKKIAEIKGHKWFRDVDWSKMERRISRPPFKPKFDFEGDTSNFVKLNRKRKSYSWVEVDQDVFKDF
ncbi:Protein kinase, catalytic domain-containing protein [Rozella allomycis CSF55]|uniref:cAMP-dependent protein kinase n=1 Tax=Rozella allomycis (strain CSF55) TaxID=988480 RepID=A0A075AVE1_ROZAC|nr:Protein kinase, catalytic domain-containing protein [Rozella allomycis CSF55]|eukprot:EPZ34296.1 Protein kinase, catalytic domain-containing protein [Rozella allomycis CSF55]